jgi:hypothetical protein
MVTFLNVGSVLKNCELGKLSQYSDYAVCWTGGVRFQGRPRNFSLRHRFRPTLGPTQSPIQWVPGALSPEVKRPGREADHSPLSSADIKNSWSYTSTSLYVLMA